MRTKVYTFALTVACSCSLFGGTYTFPAGDGDLADLATWQRSYPDLTALPGAADAVKFGSSSTFTMSSDMTVGGFTFNFQNAILDLAASGNHTLKVLNSQSAFCAHNGTIRGGTIDRNGQEFFWFQNNGYETTVTDGCVLTNANNLYVNVWGQSNGKLHLAGGSRAYVGSLTVNNGLANTVSSNTFLEVTGGSKVFTTSSYNYSDVGTKDEASGGNVLDVNGAGSAVTMDGAYIDGYHSHGNALCVSDGASFTAKTLYVGFYEGTHYSNGNRLIVDGGTVGVTGGNFYCRGDGNVIAVTNAVVDFKNKVYSYDGSDSVNTKIDIVDSTWRCGQFKAGKSIDLHVSGGSTEFETSEKFFGLGRNGAVGAKICFDGGFSWCPYIGYGYYFMEDSTNCTLTVRNGAKFSAWVNPEYSKNDKIVFCGSAADHYGAGNVISALDGGVIQGDNVQLTGRDNVLVVSNGVVRANDYIQIGSTAWASNNTLVVRGNSPRLVASGYFYLMNHSTLRMEIPTEGYAVGCVPVSANALALHESNCKFEVDVSQFKPEDRMELKLMSFGTDLTDAQQGFLLSAELPTRYSLKVVNKRDLVLKARGEPKGLMLILR